MNEIIFLIENAVEDGYTARALGESIFTEGDDLDILNANIRDAVGHKSCLFGHTVKISSIFESVMSLPLPGFFDLIVVTERERKGNLTLN